MWQYFNLLDGALPCSFAPIGINIEICYSKKCNLRAAASTAATVGGHWLHWTASDYGEREKSSNWLLMEVFPYKIFMFMQFCRTVPVVGRNSTKFTTTKRKDGN